MYICDKLPESLDTNNYCAGICIDLSKAFATIDHFILLRKIDHYGIRVHARDWFDSYWHNRYQSRQHVISLL